MITLYKKLRTPPYDITKDDCDKENITYEDERGITPLHLACIFHSIYFIKLLIKNGADIDKPDVNGHTPFHYACMNNRHLTLEDFEYLSSIGDVLKVDNSGKSSIDFIVQYQTNLEIRKFFNC